MLSNLSTPKQKKADAFKAPWNSSTKPIKKHQKAEKQSTLSTLAASLQNKLSKLRPSSSRQAMSPALSTSSSFSRLSEVDSGKAFMPEPRPMKKPVPSALAHSTSFTKFDVVERVDSATNLFEPLVVNHAFDLSKQQRRSVSFATPVLNAQPVSNSNVVEIDAEKLTFIYEKLLSTNNISDRELKASVKQLRLLVRQYGLPVSTDNALRCKVWKVFLGVYKINAAEYTSFIEQGPTHQHDKIKNDTFRTMPTDKLFNDKVSQESLSRVLNAFVWKGSSQSSQNRLLNYSYTYVQGMNVIVAPFLFVMSELEAFSCLSNHIQNHCPLYFQPALEGVHCGVKLLDMCLKILDPELFKYLNSKDLSGKVYSFPSIMTFSACTKPLSEVLILWDFLLGFGVHLNVLCVVAQLILVRAEIIASSRSMPDLNAKEIIRIVLEKSVLLPEDVYDMLARHPFDPVICDVLLTGDNDE